MNEPALIFIALTGATVLGFLFAWVLQQMKIEKGIPMPTRLRSKYPFKEMEVGDSFQVGEEMKETIRSASSIFGARNNMKFSVRKYGNGYRIWRTE